MTSQEAQSQTQNIVSFHFHRPNINDMGAITEKIKNKKPRNHTDRSVSSEQYTEKVNEELTNRK